MARLSLGALALLAVLFSAGAASAMNYDVCYAGDSIPSFKIKKNNFPTTSVNAAFNKAVSYTTRDLWKNGKVRDGCKLAGPPTKIKGCYDSVVPGTLKGKQIKGKYGFEFAAKWECPGMCTEGLCTWEYTCHIRVSTRRDGSYWRTPKLRCE